MIKDDGSVTFHLIKELIGSVIDKDPWRRPCIHEADEDRYRCNHGCNGVADLGEGGAMRIVIGHDNDCPLILARAIGEI